jgi:hypothetical protein
MPLLVQDAQMQVIEQEPAPAYLRGIVQETVRTVGALTFVFSVAFPRIQGIAVPSSFLSGLEDCNKGRTVEMEHALTQLPCGVA